MKVLRFGKVTAVFVSQWHFYFSNLLTLLTQDIFKKYQLFIPLWTLARKGKVTLAVKNRIGVVIFVKEMLLGDWNFKKSEDEGNNVRKL